MLVCAVLGLLGAHGRAELHFCGAHSWHGESASLKYRTHIGRASRQRACTSMTVLTVGHSRLEVGSNRSDAGRGDDKPGRGTSAGAPLAIIIGPAFWVRLPGPFWMCVCGRFLHAAAALGCALWSCSDVSGQDVVPRQDLQQSPSPGFSRLRRGRPRVFPSQRSACFVTCCTVCMSMSVFISGQSIILQEGLYGYGMQLRQRGAGAPHVPGGS